MFKKLIGTKDFYKRIMAITIPILIQNVITHFVSLIDNIMVGQVGTEQMSGVAIVNQLIFVFNLAIFGGTAGAGIFTAQYFGKNDHKGVRDTFRVKVIIVSAITIFTALLFYFFCEPLISLFLHEGEEGLDLAKTLAHGKSYIYIMMLQLPAFAFAQVYASTLRETGKTVLPMVSSIVAVVVNVTLNYILIFGHFGAPKLGIEGAAIATVIARYSELFVVAFWTHRQKDVNIFIEDAYKSFKVPTPLVKDILKKGTPLMANELLWSLGMTTQLQCYSVRGLEVVSAFNISSTVSNLFFCAFFAFGTSISIIIGQRLGAGEIEKAKEENTKILAFVVVICAIIGVVMALLAPIIPQAYNTIPTVKKLACEFLLVCAVLMPFISFAHCTYFTLRTGGNTIATFVFDSGFMWLICIPLAFTLSRFTSMHILVLYTIIQSLEVVKCVIGYFYLRSGKWAKNIVENI